ncbi:SusC/RagA family TonB-linked outer membrane protein [Bacteroidales bacterium]|nr:SusC/RagA family TonB-linked outer membrane protein [Bacteroidales bacterium]
MKVHFKKIPFSGCLLFAFIAISQASTASVINDMNPTEGRSVSQNEKKITGKVFDEATGEAIIGATVLLKGTNKGAATDMDGNFVILSEESGKLEISYMGYSKKSVDANSSEPISIGLKENTELLSELVVVGYGVQKKSSLTGAMQVIGETKLKDITSPQVENMLSAKVSGVNVVSGSGQPGDNAKIVIRGKSTINGSTDPLWVIDGVIVGTGAYDLNPSDIESLSVLKDAASTAIYGSQGTNGVIVVTTKRGKTGKATVNLSAKIGLTSLNKGNFAIMDGTELYDYYKSFANQSEITGAWWNEGLRNRNHDWWDGATQTGLAQDYNLSINGGTEKLKTYISLGVYDEEGAVKGYDYTRYNMRMNVDYDVYSWLKIKPQISASRKDIMNKQHSVGAMYRNLPWDSPYREDGSLVGNAPNPTWVNVTGSNYLYDLQYNYTTSEAYELMAGFDFDVKLTDWLTFSSVNNYKYNNMTRLTYVDPRSSSGLADQGRIEDHMSLSKKEYTNQLLRFDKTFDKHALNAIVGYEWNSYYSKVTNGIASGFAPGFIVADIASVPKKVDGRITEWAVQSMLSNINYVYDSKYLAQASFRRDGASNFGSNAKYGNFFSLSGGWNIHQESFFDADYITNLKLRGSYGSVGNRPNSLYPHQALYSLTTGYNENPGAIISQVANPNLTWEKTYTSGIGLDISFKQRVNLTLDVYQKNTSDLLYPVPLPGVTGVTQIWRNVGEVKNKGFEANINILLIKNNDLNWSIDANIGVNKNEVSKLYGLRQEMIVGDGSGIAGSASKLLKPGLDSDTWYLTEWAGVDPETGIGQWFMTDANGDRVKTSNYGTASKNQVTIGSYTPKFFGGFSTNLSYKHIDMAALFSYSVGGDIYNYARAEFDSDGTYTDRNQMKLHDGWNRWEKPGDQATHPQARYNNNSNSNKSSSRYLEDGTYLKLKSLSLAYGIPLEKYHIANMRIFVSGENLLTFTSFSGVDPEIPPRNGIITGVSTDVYPSTRKFMFGFNLTF